MSSGLPENDFKCWPIRVALAPAFANTANKSPAQIVSVFNFGSPRYDSCEYCARGETVSTATEVSAQASHGVLCVTVWSAGIFDMT